MLPLLSQVIFHPIVIITIFLLIILAFIINQLINPFILTHFILPDQFLHQKLQFDIIRIHVTKQTNETINHCLKQFLYGQ